MSNFATILKKKKKRNGLHVSKTIVIELEERVFYSTLHVSLTFYWFFKVEASRIRNQIFIDIDLNYEKKINEIFLSLNKGEERQQSLRGEFE